MQELLKAVQYITEASKLVRSHNRLLSSILLHTANELLSDVKNMETENIIHDENCHCPECQKKRNDIPLEVFYKRIDTYLEDIKSLLEGK